MATISDIKQSIERAKEKERAARVQIVAAKRLYRKRVRNIEGQALCALGRGLLSLYETHPDLKSDIASYLKNYLTRDSDIDAISETLGETPLGRALTGKPDISHVKIEVIN